MNSLPHDYRALVVGSSGAIGQALVRQLQTDPRCAAVLGVSRQTTPGLDLLHEDSIQACAQALATQGPFHLVLDATGALTKSYYDIQGRKVAEVDALKAGAPAAGPAAKPAPKAKPAKKGE